MPTPDEWVKQQLAQDWIAEQLAAKPQPVSQPNRAPQPKPAASPQATPEPLPTDISQLVRDNLANDGSAQQIAGSLEGAETELKDTGYIRSTDQTPVAPAQKPMAPKERSWFDGLLETGADAGVGVMNGVTLGYYDELKGLLEGDEAKAQLVDRMKLAQSRSGKAYGLGNAAGSLLPTAALSVATASPVAGATISSGLAGMGNAQGSFTERLPAGAKGAGFGLALGGLGKGVQQLGRIPTVLGDKIDDAVAASRNTPQTGMPWAPQPPVKAPGLDRALDWTESLATRAVPGGQTLAAADRLATGGAVVDGLKTAARDRILGAGQTLRNTGSRISAVGDLAIEGTAPLAASQQSRNPIAGGTNKSGYGHLTGEAATLALATDPSQLGPYAQQFQRVAGDKAATQELVTNLSNTDEYFRVNVLPKLKSSTQFKP